MGCLVIEVTLIGFLPCKGVLEADTRRTEGKLGHHDASSANVFDELVVSIQLESESKVLAVDFHSWRWSEEGLDELGHGVGRYESRGDDN